MLTVALSKPIIAALAGISVAIPSGAIVIYKNTKDTTSTTNNNGVGTEKSSKEKINETSFVVPSIEKGVEKFNNAIIVETGGTYTNLSVPNGKRKVRCKLENGTSFELCSLGKMSPIPNKKWVDQQGFNGFSFDSHVLFNFITDEKLIYKVRVETSLINEWLQNPTKKIQVFADEDQNKPLATWNTNFVITKNWQYTGKMQYVLGRTKTLTGSVADAPLNIEGKYFKCALPTQPEEYKNCEFYIFDKAQQPDKAFNSDVFVSPLEKPTTIKNKVHYVMKFDEAIDVVNTKYAYGQGVKVNIYSNQERTEQVTTGTTQIIVEELSPFALVKDGENIDVAVIV